MITRSLNGHRKGDSDLVRSGCLQQRAESASTHDEQVDTSGRAEQPKRHDYAPISSEEVSGSRDRYELYLEFAPLVKRLVNQYGTDVESRRDLIGEIYYRFCRLADAYDPDRGIPFRAYMVRQLTVSTHTHARRAWRRNGREVTLDVEEAERQIAPGGDPTPGWDHALATDHVRRAIPEALARLPRRQRQVIIWRYYEDRSYEEIADALGVQPATARSLLRHGLNGMRRWALDSDLGWD